MAYLRKLLGLDVTRQSIFVPRAALIKEHGDFLRRARHATNGRDRALLIKAAGITRRAIAYGG